MSSLDSLLDFSPNNIANQISAGDLYTPSMDEAFAPLINANSTGTSQIERAGSKAGGDDFFGQLFDVGGDTILGGARALSDSLIRGLAGQINGNNDAQERQTFETIQTTPQTAGLAINSKTLLVGGAVLAVVLGVLMVVTRR